MCVFCGEEWAFVICNDWHDWHVMDDEDCKAAMLPESEVEKIQDLGWCKMDDLQGADVLDWDNAWQARL